MLLPESGGRAIVSQQSCINQGDFELFPINVFGSVGPRISLNMH